MHIVRGRVVLMLLINECMYNFAIHVELLGPDYISCEA